VDHFQKQVDDLTAVKKAVSKEGVKGLFIESLANPLLLLLYSRYRS